MRFGMLFLMVCAILSASFVAPLPSALASDDELTRKTLVGLQGVYVIVESFSPESTKERAENDRLTKEKLQTCIELSLRKTGIKVATFDEWVKQSNWNIGELYLNIGLMPSSTYSYVYSCDLQLVQDVHLRRDFTRCLATTWSVGCFGNIGSTRLASGMQETVTEQVDQFCNAYLAANPKK